MSTRTAGNTRFWSALDTLVEAHSTVIDRPKGSQHPRYSDFVYPLDYGYLEGTRSGDGHGIDVWVGSMPSRRVTGAILTADSLKRDVEIKLLLGCTPEEASAAMAAHNSGTQAGLLIMREA